MHDALTHLHTDIIVRLAAQVTSPPLTAALIDYGHGTVPGHPGTHEDQEPGEEPQSFEVRGSGRGAEGARMASNPGIGGFWYHRAWIDGGWVMRHGGERADRAKLGGRYAGVDSARANGDFLVPFGSAGEGAGGLWSSILWRTTKAGSGRGEFPGPRVAVLCSRTRHNTDSYPEDFVTAQ